jgi:hypothetical protein
VHHNVGLDTLFYSYWEPVNISRAITIMSCPGGTRIIDSDFVHSSVVIGAGGSVTYDGLAFAVSASGYRPQWPSNNPLLLSIYDVRDNGRLTFRNSVFSVRACPGLQRGLLAGAVAPGLLPGAALLHWVP